MDIPTQVVQHTAGIKSAMYPRNLFIYSAYWGKWSRVLRWMNRGVGDGSHDITQVEVDLEPLGYSDADWVRVGQANIRRHRTQRNDRDVVSAYLPIEVVHKMEAHLDATTVDSLLHADLLPMIDWAKYERLCNGGCPLHLCIKE